MSAYKKVTVGDLRRQLLRVPDDAELLISCEKMHAMQFSHAVYGTRENWLNLVIEQVEWPEQPPTGAAP